MKLYVGNLSYSTSEDMLRAEFGVHGEVGEVAVVTDRDTGRPRGFGFVTMSSDDDARNAITALNGKELDGRTLNVNEARPRQSGGRQRRSGGGNRRDSW